MQLFGPVEELKSAKMDTIKCIKNKKLHSVKERYKGKYIKKTKQNVE